MAIETPAEIEAQINADIISGIPGGIKAPTVNMILNYIAASYTPIGSCAALTIARAQIPTTNIAATPGLTTFSVVGFNTSGDLGAGAIYTSVGATSVGPGAIQDAGGTWYNLVINGPLNAGWTGATGNGITDDTVAIQSALNITDTFLPAGTYLIGQIAVPSRTMLLGSGLSTELLAKPALNLPLIVLASANTYMVQLYDFIINGNASNQSSSGAHGIFFNNPNPITGEILVGSGDPRHRIEHVTVYNTLGHGIYTEGYGATVIHDIQIYSVFGYGVYLSAFDSYLDLADIGGTGLSGVYLDSTAGSTRISNVKSWYSGWNGSSWNTANGDGFRIQASGVVAQNIETQDNGGNGLLLQNTSLVSVSNFASQDVSRFASGIYSAVMLDNATECTIAGGYARGMFSGTQYGGTVVQTKNGSSLNSVILGASVADFLNGVTTSNNSSNTIIINGIVQNSNLTIDPGPGVGAENVSLTLTARTSGGAAETAYIIVGGNGALNLEPVAGQPTNVTSPVVPQTYTIAQLLALTPVQGAFATVKDTVGAAAPTWHLQVAGGGGTSVNCSVWCNGTNWFYI